jgi:hypothetical protein
MTLHRQEYFTTAAKSCMIAQPTTECDMKQNVRILFKAMATLSLSKTLQDIQWLDPIRRE